MDAKPTEVEDVKDDAEDVVENLKTDVVNAVESAKADDEKESSTEMVAPPGNVNLTPKSITTVSND